MKFRKLMLVLTFTVSIIFVTVIGATYAYYYTSSGSVGGTAGNFNSSLGIVFNNSDHINFFTGIPISSSEIDTKANTTTFTLTPSNVIISDYDVNVDINLSNIDIDNELKVNSFKYKLKCVHSITGNEQVFSGDASSFTNSSYTIASLSSTINGNNGFYIDRSANSQSYSCTFYVWLEETNSNQNTLMNKHFGANIEINSVVKKR